MSVRSLTVMVAVLAWAAASDSAAWATFPGLNGQLAYERAAGGAPNLFAVQPLAEPSNEESRLTSTGAVDRDAAWSADGRRIAFMSERDGNAEVYVMNADGSAPARLTTDPALDADPTFSPDGTRIAFTSMRDGNPEIYVMNSDGSAQTRLTADPAVDQQADWSPDGGRIAFESTRDGNMELYTMDPGGGAVTRLTFEPGVDAEASWHPDDGRIAYTSGPTGAADIYTLRPGISGPSQLTRFSGDHHFPAWSPDGQQIAYTSGFGSTLVMTAGGQGFGTFAASGTDAAWGPLPPPPPVPKVTETVNVEPRRLVFVRVSGAAAAVRLRDPREIPVGSRIDTRRGAAVVAAANRNERSTYPVLVSAGRATLTQTGRRNPVTVLRVPRARCGAGGSRRATRLRARTGASLAAASARGARRKKKKKVKVKGPYSEGASTQTDWITINTCDSTITRVRSGVVEVTDFVTGRVELVRAGESYTARAGSR